MDDDPSTNTEIAHKLAAMLDELIDGTAFVNPTRERHFREYAALANKHSLFCAAIADHTTRLADELTDTLQQLTEDLNKDA